MTDYGYQLPVSSFLTRGVPELIGNWPNYLAFGFTSQHADELIRMMTDRRLLEIRSDLPEVWAPVHAWRTLGQLRAEEAVQPLVKMLSESDDDYLHEDAPQVLGMIGKSAIPPVQYFLKNTQWAEIDRATASGTLVRIAEKHPETRGECIGILVEELQRFSRKHRVLNSFLICQLLAPKADESYAIIETAYKRRCVDESIVEWNHVATELTPVAATQNSISRSFFFDEPPLGKTKAEQRKKKQKRKAAAKSRKLARRRK